MRTYKKNLILSLCLILTLTLTYSCKKDDKNDTNQANFQTSTPPFTLTDKDVKFYKDHSYGKHSKNKFDFFIPKSNQPTPLIVYIHGGGFTSGQKENAYNIPTIKEAINQSTSEGIAFASINYELLKEVDDRGVIKCLEDVKEFIQYIRLNHDKYNISKAHIVLSGNSAGAGSSLWLGLQDDLAKPESSLAQETQSTRVKGIAVFETQSTYDLKKWEDVFSEYNFSIDVLVQLSPAIAQRLNSFYGMADVNQLENQDIIDYRKRVDFPKFASSDDPEVWVNNTQQQLVPPLNLGILFHHANHATYLENIFQQNNVVHDIAAGPGNTNKESFVNFVIRTAKK
ncbi:MAG: alpha/beta hydrolase [Flavobacteriales bacterium]|jgi:hypothetical protein|nr:alpha/beta hydrolase [Flavobacteriales bacterium]